MAISSAFSLRIFIADGDPDGLRLVERSNWIGKAVIFPRALYPQVRGREELQQTGVYLLVGPREDSDGDKLYIGEGDPVRPRLDSHYAKKDFWTRAVFFVAGPGQLNKAHVQFLEAQLIQRAQSAKRMPLENGNIPTEPTLSEADRADMEVFLDNMLGMLPVLGIQAFEQSLKPTAIKGNMLTCMRRGILAKGHDTPQGFVVQEGSHAAREHVPSLTKHFPRVTLLRDELTDNGVLVPDRNRLRFTQNYTFSSPSMASNFVLGRPSNGRKEWKNIDGQTLKALQEAEAKGEESIYHHPTDGDMLILRN